eukprot:scaffold301_cov243-Pinguiococcus_pyrenoidosus.AAC.26
MLLSRPARSTQRTLLETSNRVRSHIFSLESGGVAFRMRCQGATSAGRTYFGLFDSCVGLSAPLSARMGARRRGSGPVARRRFPPAALVAFPMDEQGPRRDHTR